MPSDSLFKDAIRSLSNTFFKVIGFAIALFVVIIGLSVLSSGPSRSTTTNVLPNHTWKSRPFSQMTPTLVRIPVVGEIGMNPLTTQQQLQHVLEDLVELDLKPGMLKGILLYINSPGGTSDDSEIMFRTLLEFKKKMHIPVYAYIDGLCASGGMMISLAADKVIASSPSLVGHVGVIMPTAFNFSSTMDKVGIQSMTLHAGKGKDELNPYRPWKPDEGATIQKIINAYYDRFVKLVAQYRPRLTEDQLREQGAQVYPAQEALELGYIDEVNDSYLDTLEEIASSLEIVNNYQVIELEPHISLHDLLVGGPNSLLGGKIYHYLRTPGDVDPSYQGKMLYLYRP